MEDQSYIVCFKIIPNMVLIATNRLFVITENNKVKIMDNIKKDYIDYIDYLKYFDNNFIIIM